MNLTKNEYIKKYLKMYYKFNKKPKFIQDILKLELSIIYDKHFKKG